MNSRRRAHAVQLLCAFCFGLCALPARADLLIRASPEGSESATASEVIEHPGLAVSLERALALLRDPLIRSAAGGPKEPVIIRLDPGTYWLTRTIRLGPEFSGTEQHPITIEGPVDGTAVISGGRPVTAFSAATDQEVLARLHPQARGHVLQADLRTQGIDDYGVQRTHGFAAAHKPTALELFFEGRRMPLARWPNDGFAAISNVIGTGAVAFSVKGANLSSWKDEPNLLASGYWSKDWADATIPVKAIEPSSGRIELTAPAPYGVKTGQRVFIQNALSELDTPGEWYLDARRVMLYFWPPGPISTQSQPHVSVINELLVMDGARFVRLNRLTFEDARGDAIVTTGVDHVELRQLVVRDAGNRAIVLHGTNSGVFNTLIEEVGESGIDVAGGDRSSLAPGNLTVVGCTIRRFAQISRTMEPAVYLSGVANSVVENRISDAPHMAIYFSGNDHRISRNDVSRVCTETGDAGAIYTGRDWTARGTIVSNNHVHDIPANVQYGGTKAVYLDDQASGITVEGNLFERVNEAVFVGGGRDNLIEGNTFVDTATPIYLDARGTGWQKEVTADPSGAFHRALAAVPYSSPLWSSRYPHLANILDDQPGRPKYNIARNNTFVRSGPMRIAPDAQPGIVFEGSGERHR